MGEHGKHNDSAADERAYRPATKAILAGRQHNDTALAPIIWASTTFSADTIAQAREMATSQGPVKFYSRYGNPSVQAFEAAIAELEGAETALAFGSGMGAISAIILGLCSPGDHIVAQRQLYAGTQLVFQTMCPRFGIDVTFVDGTQPGAFQEAVRPGKTMLLFAETPANPCLDLVDLKEFGAIKGPMKIVDSTFATPLGQNPLRFGVDLVVHSATKGIGGHNDALLGVIAGSEELIAWLWSFAVLQGAAPSPYDATNGLRGLRTLGVRLRAQAASALEIARRLEADPRVTHVRYPGLVSHPQHALASEQMQSYGGMISFELNGGLGAGEAFISTPTLMHHAASLGGPETLVTHPASTTHVNLLPEEAAATGITPGLIRCSLGLEDVEDIWSAFEQSLASTDAAG